MANPLDYDNAVNQRVELGPFQSVVALARFRGGLAHRETSPFFRPTWVHGVIGALLLAHGTFQMTFPFLSESTRCGKPSESGRR